MKLLKLKYILVLFLVVLSCEEDISTINWEYTGFSGYIDDHPWNEIEKNRSFFNDNEDGTIDLVVVKSDVYDGVTVAPESIKIYNVPVSFGDTIQILAYDKDNSRNNKEVHCRYINSDYDLIFAIYRSINSDKSKSWVYLSDFEFRDGILIINGSFNVTLARSIGQVSDSRFSRPDTFIVYVPEFRARQF